MGFEPMTSAIPVRCSTNLTLLPMCGFIAQLVEHRTGIAEVMGSNPVEALIFFRLLLSSCLNWKIYCDDHTSLSVSFLFAVCWSWFFFRRVLCVCKDFLYLQCFLFVKAVSPVGHRRFQGKARNNSESLPGSFFGEQGNMANLNWRTPRQNILENKGT